MASTNVVTKKEPNNAHFDSIVYLDHFTENREDFPTCASELIGEFIPLLHKAFADHPDWTGQTLLDLGSGPSLWHLASACEKYDNITLSDPLHDNRMALEKFRNDVSYDVDWMKYFKQTEELDEKEAAWTETVDHLRSRIQKVVSCDILKECPLGEDHPNHVKYDCVTSSVFLEVACANTADHRSAVKTLLSLAKTRGRIVLAGNVDDAVHGSDNAICYQVREWLEEEGCYITYFHFCCFMHGKGAYVIAAYKMH